MTTETKMKYEPKPYQREVWEKTREDKNHALFLDPGLGKSKILLDTAFYLYEKGELDGLIVVSHISVAENWFTNEVPKHKWEDCRTLLYTSDTPATKTAPMLEKGMFNILLTNKETFRNKKHQQTFTRLVRSGKWMVAVDESTCIKNPTALQTKGVLKVANPDAAYTRILSGEPMTNSPLDLFGQYKLIMPEVFGRMTKSQFVGHFCDTVVKRYGGRQFNEVQGWSETGKIKFEKLVEKVTTRLKKEDAGLNLPPVQTFNKHVAMSNEQVRLYNQMLNESRATFSNGQTVDVDVVVAKLIKLHQITSGFLHDGEGNWVELPTPKLSMLDSIIRGFSPQPIVIWCNYRKDIERVTEHLRQEHKVGVSRVYGGISSNERMDELAKFANGTNLFLVANPQSIGWGLTLTQASKAIYYSHSYNYELRKQSEDRIHRIGQEAPRVDYFNIVAQDTIDQKIVQAVERKRKEAGNLFQKQTLGDLARALFGVHINPNDITDEQLEVEE